jgi:hypothetical protein
MSASSTTTQIPGRLIPGRLRQQAITALIPFFTDAGTDPTLARGVARDILEDYHPATPKELQLAAQIIALGFAALACLSAAMTVKEGPLNEMLRLQKYAIALDRASQKATRALEARRRERSRQPQKMTPENTAWDDGVFQSAIRLALDRMSEANVRLATVAATPEPAEPKLKLLSAEPMTKAVLGRRKRP